MPTPADLRARALELLELAERMEADERRAAELTGGKVEPIPKGMETTDSTAVHSGPKIASDGIASKAAKALGLSFPELAKELAVNYHTLKTQNRRGTIPPETQAAIAALVKKHASKK